MPRRTPAPLLLLALGAACATGASGPPPGPVDRILAVESGRVIKQTVDDNTKVVVDAPVERVWSALLGAYGELEIAGTEMDRSGGIFGNSGFPMPARLNKRPADDYFDCGTLRGMLSVAGRVRASVQSQITSTPDGKTTLVTNVRGTYKSSEGTSTRPVTCGSTGLIEQLLHEKVAARLAAR
jgi:hypothetical protein